MWEGAPSRLRSPRSARSEDGSGSKRSSSVITSGRVSCAAVWEVAPVGRSTLPGRKAYIGYSHISIRLHRLTVEPPRDIDRVEEGGIKNERL